MKALAELVQALPTELYDEILELTLIIEEMEVHINKGYLPPVQLQIDRISRQAIAANFYANTIFTLDFDPFRLANDLLGPWLKSIEDQRLIVSTIRLDTPEHHWIGDLLSQLLNGDFDLEKMHIRLIEKWGILDLAASDMFQVLILGDETEEAGWFTWTEIKKKAGG